LQQSNFDNFSDQWWEDDGPLKVLHSMNKTRMLFIQERLLNRYQSLETIEEIFLKKNILDLGCGGGILAESLAKKGANVTAIDTSKSLIDVAKKRSLNKNLKINYKVGDIKSLKKKHTKFDIIISLEVIEHVCDYEIFLKDIFSCLKKNGIIIISTINRNFFSYLSTIIIAEKIFRIVPKGTHDWDKYIKPCEILKCSEKYKIHLDKKSGLFPIPFGKSFKWIRTKNVSSNYILSLIN
tara:strand:- start:10 stop:723 length:714 start_codon:yes stop_codon:yes gene_type:complete